MMWYGQGKLVVEAGGGAGGVLVLLEILFKNKIKIIFDKSRSWCCWWIL